MDKLFFSQRILDALVEEKKITFNKNFITILAKDNPTFELGPALRVTRTADSSPDPYALVGRVLHEQELKAMQAEVYLDSIIYKEKAYVAEPGFIGEKKELLDTLSDTDLLARFLLEHLL